MKSRKLTRSAPTQPLRDLQWIHRSQLRPNDWNPNVMPPNEWDLLKISILEDGWTQPIVLFRLSGTSKLYIVDGEHRWKMSGEPEILAKTDGLVPVVFITGDKHHLMMSTIRHNRARGEHAISRMASMIQEFKDAGLSDEDIQHYLQMEDEEVQRLAEKAGSPEVVAREHGEFNKGWQPGPKRKKNEKEAAKTA